jgi:hypothetical protein
VVTSAWPYPPFPSPDWLGGAGSGDPALVAATATVKSLLGQTGGRVDGDPRTLLAALGRAGELAERLDWVMLSLVGEARAHGMPWAEIGLALGVSKQAVHARFARYVAEALARAPGATSGG